LKVRKLHPFEHIPPRDGIRLQKWLASQVITTGRFRRKLRLVAAADCSPSPDGRLHASVVLCEAPSWEVVEEATASAMPFMPYVPGLLSFREAPIVLEALRKLPTRPDVLLVDGHGIAHPRGVGIATHIGLHVDVPTIGVGKTKLCGVHGEPGRSFGNWVALTNRGKRIGVALTTRDNTRPVYVSTGHRIGLLPAARIVLACVKKFRIPEPIRQADQRSRRAARAGAEIV
jgi:deoxyribonuclease V